MDAALKISREAEAAAALRDMLGKDAEDAELLNDMIEGETSLFEMIDALLNYHFQDVELISGITERENALAVRKKRIQNRIEFRRAKLEQALAIYGEKIERPEATLSLVKRKASLIVTEESEIPSEYWKQQKPKLNEAALKAALKDGKQIPGVTLNNSPETVTIRPR